MTSVGTGYDLSVSTYSPDGRLFQVEYAGKAVDNSGTTIGIRTKDGVVLAVEKIIPTKLEVPGSNKRIFSIDKHIGFASSGWMPDVKGLVARAREEAWEYQKLYKVPTPSKILAERIGMYIQAYTLYSSVRPFGAMPIMASVDKDGPQLYMFETSGAYYGYRGCATGKAKQLARTELEKLDIDSLSIRDAIKEAARIIYTVHDDSKDKLFELELAWVSQESGNVFSKVPQDIFDEAVQYAKRANDDDSDDDDDL
ncbi:Proteasome subunit alpha type-3 [Smittium mucronatum]|uniref:Proteasome subunit alpha type n=1 Tax=Smittium mucronatum TaxID=133383 RepID=A0A1R0GRL8_9FUNG|nr:Proteasome subunit alpha type-3 [Smittium mucronatum]